MHDDALRRSAQRLRIALFVAMALMAALYLSARFGLGLGPAHVEYRIHGPDVRYARVIADVTTVLLLLALFRLTQMLGRIAAGETFSAGVIGRFRSFAFWLLTVALFTVLGPIAVQALQPAARVHRLELAIDFRAILVVGTTLALFLIARLLERAGALDAEMREII
jgi:hypothetical protein